MSETVTTSGSSPASKGLLSRIIGIITAPRETFTDVARAPRWLGILVVTILASALFTALPLTTPDGRQAALDQQVTQMKSFGFEVNDRMYEQMERRAAIMPYTTAGGVIVVGPIMAVLITGILFAIFNAAMGGTATFKQVFSVVVHAGVISTLSAVFSGTLNYFRGTMSSATNLSALLPMLPEHSFVGHFLSAIDIFLIWYIIVLAIGLAVLYRRRTQPIAITLFAIYGVIAVVVALVKTKLGGA
jgi:Yip1 domain